MSITSVCQLMTITQVCQKVALLYKKFCLIVWLSHPYDNYTCSPGLNMKVSTYIKTIQKMHRVIAVDRKSDASARILFFVFFLFSFISRERYVNHHYLSHCHIFRPRTAVQYDEKYQKTVCSLVPPKQHRQRMKSDSPVIMLFAFNGWWDSA